MRERKRERTNAMMSAFLVDQLLRTSQEIPLDETRMRPCQLHFCTGKAH